MKITNDLLKEIGFYRKQGSLLFNLDIGDSVLTINQQELNSKSYNYHPMYGTVTTVDTIQELIFCIALDFKKQGNKEKQSHIKKALGIK